MTATITARFLTITVAMTAMAAQMPTNSEALAYINRLSDYLFVLARVANDDGRADVKWVPGANR